MQAARQKLDSLVEEALQKGTPICETYDIMAQCARVKRLAAMSDALKGREIIKQSLNVDRMAVKMERER